MKKNQWLYLAIAAGVVWYYWKRRKTSTASTAPIVQQAKAVASDVVDKMVDATQFKIDTTSFADTYAKEGMSCK
jgi:hypothetical protein